MSPEKFRFSPNQNRAADIEWRSWGAAALDEAARLDRPVLLNLTAVWCHWCHLMDETTYSDPSLIELINSELVAIRVDADRNPHVQDRYIAGGWPTNAFLTPTGEVLWAGTYVEAAQLRDVATGVLAAWAERREELEQEIGRRRRALEAARGRAAVVGLVRREWADDVLLVMRDTFDERNGGFGTAPKFPQTDCIELMYAEAARDPSWGVMADQTLDGMLSGELRDPVDGGFFRYSMEADWTSPRHEKLLDVNAGVLDAYTCGATVRDRQDWRDVAAGIIEWVDATLDSGDSLWYGSQSADPAYFRADASARAGMPAPPVDGSIYSGWNARWIAALADAGARLGNAAWVTRAAAGLDALLTRMSAPGGGLFHYAEAGGEPQLDILLADTLDAARACLRLAQATGDARWIAAGRTLARHMEKAFWSEDGGFWDRIRTDHDVGALRYRDRPFELNAAAARLLLDLAHVTGERTWRGLAEQTLARIGPQAGRYGPAGALFALAASEFFEPPPAVFIALPADVAIDEAAGLRTAALALPVPRLRVWTVPAGHRVGPHAFPAAREPAAYVWTPRGTSPAITTADQLPGAAARVLRDA